MGGHGGLNILPQKRWNVYNFDNREKVRKDEEAAAKEEQLKREDSRKRDAEFRLERLRTSRGLAPLIPEPQSADPAPAESAEPTPSSEPVESGNHINLFEGIRIFDLAEEPRREKSEERSKKRAKKEEVRVVTAEDEKYRVGYGLAGKGVKIPWYLEKKGRKERGEDKGEERIRDDDNIEKKRKKSLEELREERLKREERENKREQDLLRGKDHLPRDRERLGKRDDGCGSRYFEPYKKGSRYFSTR